MLAISTTQMIKFIFILILVPLTAWSSPTPSIQNFKEVEAGLYRGGHPNDEDLHDLRRLGIRTVIDLQGGDAMKNPIANFFVKLISKGEQPRDIRHEEFVTKSLGMNFYNFPLSSLHRVTEKEAASIDQVIEILRDQANYPIYIHCAHGRDRTGLVMAIARVRLFQWSIKDSYREMKSFGHKKSDKLDHYLLSVERKRSASF